MKEIVNFLLKVRVEVDQHLIVLGSHSAVCSHGNIMLQGDNSTGSIRKDMSARATHTSKTSDWFMSCRALETVKHEEGRGKRNDIIKDFLEKCFYQ